MKTENIEDINSNDLDAVADFCEKHNIHCVLIGPEEPLSNGLADHLIRIHPNLMVFGPLKDGAQLEVNNISTPRVLRKTHSDIKVIL